MSKPNPHRDDDRDKSECPVCGEELLTGEKARHIREQHS